MNADRPCACGCGALAARKSRYFGNHFQRFARARRKLREWSWHALDRGIPFSLTLADVRELVDPLGSTVGAFAIERIDKSAGFVRGNVRVVRRRPKPRRAVDPAKLRRRLESLVAQEGIRQLSVHDLETTYEAQHGRCALSGRRLAVSTHRGDPDAIRVQPRDDGRPLGPGNVCLVTAATHDTCRAWGLAHVLELARGIAREERRTGRTAQRRAAPTRRAVSRGA